MTPHNTELGFAIVGAGSIARIHASAIAATPGATLQAVHDCAAAKARAFAAEFGGEPSDNLEEVLARHDVDVVCVTVPNSLHGEITLQALRAGKHVVCEKPLEITTARIDEMIAAAEQSGRILAPVFQLRFQAGAGYLKQAVVSGRFGRLSLCSAYVKWWRDSSYYTGSSWRGSTELNGGGALMNQAIHAVDLLQWFVGMPVAVSAQTRTRIHPIHVEDTAAVVLEFASGAIGVIEAATSCFPGMQQRIELSGEKGTAVLENGRIVTWQFADARPEDYVIRRRQEPVAGSGASDPAAIGFACHRLLIEDVVKCIIEGTPPLISCHEARNVVAIVEAIYRSSATQTRVVLA
jgi:predicted dehydrogenase